MFNIEQCHTKCLKSFVVFRKMSCFASTTIFSLYLHKRKQYKIITKTWTSHKEKKSPTGRYTWAISGERVFCLPPLVKDFHQFLTEEELEISINTSLNSVYVYVYVY